MINDGQVKVPLVRPNELLGILQMGWLHFRNSNLQKLTLQKDQEESCGS